MKIAQQRSLYSRHRQAKLDATAHALAMNITHEKEMKKIHAEVAKKNAVFHRRIKNSVVNIRKRFTQNHPYLAKWIKGLIFTSLVTLFTLGLLAQVAVVAAVGYVVSGAVIAAGMSLAFFLGAIFITALSLFSYLSGGAKFIKWIHKNLFSEKVKSQEKNYYVDQRSKNSFFGKIKNDWNHYLRDHPNVVPTVKKILFFLSITGFIAGVVIQFPGLPAFLFEVAKTFASGLLASGAFLGSVGFTLLFPIAYTVAGIALFKKLYHYFYGENPAHQSSVQPSTAIMNYSVIRRMSKSDDKEMIMTNRRIRRMAMENNGVREMISNDESTREVLIAEINQISPLPKGQDKSVSCRSGQTLRMFSPASRRLGLYREEEKANLTVKTIDTPVVNR